MCIKFQKKISSFDIYLWIYKGTGQICQQDSFVHRVL